MFLSQGLKGPARGAGAYPEFQRLTVCNREVFFNFSPPPDIRFFTCGFQVSEIVPQRPPATFPNYG